MKRDTNDSVNQSAANFMTHYKEKQRGWQQQIHRRNGSNVAENKTVMMDANHNGEMLVLETHIEVPLSKAISPQNAILMITQSSEETQ